MRWQLYGIRVFLSRSAQRVSIFQNNVEREVSVSASSRQKVKPICATRWVERHDSLIICDTTASSCFYTWRITAGKHAIGCCDQNSNFAQFCTEMHVFLPCAIVCKVSDMSAKLCLLPLPRIC